MQIHSRRNFPKYYGGKDQIVTYDWDFASPFFLFQIALSYACLQHLFDYVTLFTGTYASYTPGKCLFGLN